MRCATRLLVLAGALALAGCVQPMQRETVIVDTRLSEAELAPFRAPGTATVVGQAFMRQRGGGIVTCAGSPVILSPDLPPIRQAINAARSGKAVDHTGGAWGTSARKTICDAQGNFHFENLPAESWYVITQVQWEVAGSLQGGYLGIPITTRADQQEQVYLTDDSFISRY